VSDIPIIVGHRDHHRQRIPRNLDEELKRIPRRRPGGESVSDMR